MKHDKFGRGSEQCPLQGDLFNEAEALLDPDETGDNGGGDETQTITYERRKPKRQPLPKNLPRETVIQCPYGTIAGKSFYFRYSGSQASSPSSSQIDVSGCLKRYCS